MRYPYLALTLLMLTPAALAAQAKAPPQGPRVVRLAITPAPEPTPAMKWRLLPPPAEVDQGNAALLYLTAIQLSEELKKKEDAIDSLLEQPPGALDPGEVRATGLARTHSAMRYCELGARRSDCDWQVPFREEGYRVLFPHLTDMRWLAQLVALNGRTALAERDFNSAIRGLQTGFAMSLDVNEGGMVIHSLVTTGMASLHLQTVEQWIGLPDAPNLYWALADLPRPMASPIQAMENDRLWLNYTFPQLKQAREGRLSNEEFGRMMDQAMQTIHGPSADRPPLESLAIRVVLAKYYPQARQYLAGRGYSPEQIEAMPVRQALAIFFLDSYDQWYDEMSKWARLPYWQANQGIARFDQKLQETANRADSPPLVMLFLPSLSRFQMQTAVLDRNIAILQCVEAIRAYAASHDSAFPKSLDQITDTPAPIDPLTGRPFIYRVEGDTAVIVSASPRPDTPKWGVRYELTIRK